MNSEHVLTEKEIAVLIGASKKMQPGEVINGSLERRLVEIKTGAPKIIVKFIPNSERLQSTNSTTNNIIYYPFNVKMQDKVIAIGYLNTSIFKKIKLGYKILKHNLSNSDVKIYRDKRGFDYYVKYKNGVAILKWFYLEDGTIVEILNENRDIVKVNDKKYILDEDGLINFSLPLDEFTLGR